MNEIKIGYCVAYDWEMLQYALPTIYRYADFICVSIDRNGRSWSGANYQFDKESFQHFIQTIDTEKKIKIYQDNFFVSGLTASQNEVRQRQLLSRAMGEGGWHIQLDCDEYFFDFKGFTDYLKSLTSKNKLFNVCCPLMTLFKQVDGGYVYVSPERTNEIEFIQIASQTPQYQYGRRNGHFNIYTNFLIAHQSWARREEEIVSKIKNWGHVNDFDRTKFFNLWKSITIENYAHVKNVHPIYPELWPALKFTKAASINELLTHPQSLKTAKFSSIGLAAKNSRIFIKVKSLFMQ